MAKSRSVATTIQSLEVLADLGIDASDLLQARSVIWVEGPSDRVYVKRWLELVAPELREGVDYSVMFYGGRLLSHLSLGRDNPAPSDALIALLRINQHPAVVIDSDRANARGRLNDTKRRVIEECEKERVPCWVTDGREMENYLPGEVIAEVYAELTGNARPLTLEKYERLEAALERAHGRGWLRKWSYDAAKVAIARRIAPKLDQRHVTTSLRRALRPIIAVIRGAR